MDPSTFTPVRENGVLKRVDATINLATGVDIPDTDTGANKGPDFFLVVRTSRDISFNDSFTVRVPYNGLYFESGASAANSTVTSRILHSNVPIFCVPTPGTPLMSNR